MDRGGQLAHTGKDGGAQLLDIHRRSASRILDTCQRNHGLYIKIGQQIASQNHVLPAEFSQQFRKLYDDAPSVPYAEVVKLFQHEFGGKVGLQMLLQCCVPDYSSDA